MMNTFKTLLASVALLTASAAFAQPQLNLKLDKAEKSVSPTFYGLMTEEINYSYEGGLYAQLISNNSFIEDRNGPRRMWTPWKSGGPKYWNLTDTVSSHITMEREGGFNRANPHSICLDAKKGVALVNDGFWGFPVKAGAHFEGDFYAKAASDGPQAVVVSLVSGDGKVVFAQKRVENIGKEWAKHTFSFDIPADVAATKDVKFSITACEDGKYWFSRITLFPETFNGRENGLRKDLMGMMREMSPKFLRFPGGNYLEGNDFKNRFDWKRTIGAPDTRPGHQSPWGYRSTDGMGLMEFLLWAEDVGAEPLVGVFAGYVLSGDYLTADYIDPFVDDALDEIEYIIGGPETKWGAQRVKDGHPEPFPLHYVEIGNEDFFDRSYSYPARYMKFYNAIKAKYPQLHIVASVDEKTMKEHMEKSGFKDVKLDVVDEHYYRNTEGMYRAATQYDTYDRKGPKVFCGEWASREGSPTTNMNAALGDAAWMAAMERNSDIVIANCYAPLFVNVNKGGMQWESDLIGYDAISAYGSPSYYAQCMFAGNVGDKIVPLEAAAIPTMKYGKDELPQLYYSATLDSKSGKVYLKVVNGGDSKVDLRVNADGGKVSGKAVKSVLSSARPEDTNTIDNPKNIVPVVSKQKAGKSFVLSLAPYSITVLAM